MTALLPAPLTLPACRADAEGDTRWSSAQVRLLLNRGGDTFTVSTAR